MAFALAQYRSVNSLRLSRQQRLKTPADFQRVYTSKQWGGSKYYTFNVNAVPCQNISVDNQELSLCRPILGVTVSKKVSKNAVDRNRIKRQIKEFFRLHQDQLSIDGNFVELVITAKPIALGASDQQRYESLAELWIKILKWQRWHHRQLKINSASTLIE